MSTALLEDLARPGETLFAWTIFPLALFGPVALAILLLGRGADPAPERTMKPHLLALVMVAATLAWTSSAWARIKVTSSSRPGDWFRSSHSPRSRP